MSFTSYMFMIAILPWFIILVYLTRRHSNLRKLWMFLANSVFYVWGGAAAFLFICLYSLIIWLLTILVSRTAQKAKAYLFISVIIALMPLLAVKYVTFFVENINAVTGCSLTLPSMVIPIGISFFTFEAVSLLCDIHDGRVTDNVSPVSVYLYLTFFPTVTSGPIFRFGDFVKGFGADINASNYGDALDRLVIGLGKKVLIADKLAPLADYYFDGIARGGSYSCAGLWLGSITYTLQLYFDFSGYSDMAIAIGKFLGFDICENFNAPYQAKSISDFWRRWHISLSTWFRDYVYIPLGGNRCAKFRHIFNLFVVWVLTGIWHGADWSFVLWGLGYFVLLTLEKYIPAIKRIGDKWFGHIYTLFFVNLLWIPFRADNLSVALKYIQGLVGVNCVFGMEDKSIAFLPYLLFSICLCLPFKKWFAGIENKKAYKMIKGLLIILIAGLSLCAVVNAAYSPYIYGKF